jgi:chromosome segregation ATPase
MKRLATLALAVLFCVSAKAQPASPAQQPQPRRQGIELELLELEQDVDKALLREALTLQGRRSMKVAPDAPAERDQLEKEAAALSAFIANKKDAIIARAAELTKPRAASRRGATAASPDTQPARADKQAILEKIENAQIEIQLLETRINLLRTPLNEAVQALATAELAASNDETQRPKAEAARKQYEKVKASFVEQSTRLQSAQQELQSMHQSLGGFGGGFR